MLFGRKLRTKLPEVDVLTTLDEEIRDRDRERKHQGKIFADSDRGARKSEIEEGDTVGTYYYGRPLHTNWRRGSNQIHTKSLTKWSAQ